jgi:hypothetical protein
MPADLVSSGIFLLMAVGHFAAQWYGWNSTGRCGQRQMTGDPVRGGTRVHSAVRLVPGRYRHVHFFELLAANSVIGAS